MNLNSYLELNKIQTKVYSGEEIEKADDNETATNTNLEMFSNQS